MVRILPFRGIDTGSNPVRGICYFLKMYNINFITYNKKLFFKNAYELKIRLLYILLSLILTIICCYIYSDAIIYVLVNPILIKMNSQRFIFTSLKEIFFLYLKISLILSLIFTLPIILIQLLFFFSNGLYKYELKKIIFISILSSFLFIFGYLLGYKLIIPNIWNFFLEFEKQNAFFPLHFEAKLENYLFFILNMLFGIVFCFQIPIILLVLNLFNIFKRNEQILINRKIIYLFIIIIGTFISSPDILNQFFIFSIFILMYEIYIYIHIFFTKF